MTRGIADCISQSRQGSETIIFGDQVFDTKISRTVKFPDATIAAEPITTYAPSHAGALAYRRLAREVIARGHSA